MRTRVIPIRMMQSDSPKQVAENLKRFLRKQGSLKDAAAKLGVGPTTISNQLNGKSYFTRKNARRYAAVFGINPDYLVTGIGEVHSDFNEPGPMYPMFTQEEKSAGSLEERIVTGVRAQLEKLNDLGSTYDNLVQHIVEIAGYITPGSPNYEYCQKVIERIKDFKTPPVIDLLIGQ